MPVKIDRREQQSESSSDRVTRLRQAAYDMDTLSQVLSQVEGSAEHWMRTDRERDRE
ncbi:hypothetical protein GCM10028792_13760 [Salinisphaera aquimarina]